MKKLLIALGVLATIVATYVLCTRNQPEVGVKNERPVSRQAFDNTLGALPKESSRTTTSFMDTVISETQEHLTKVAETANAHDSAPWYGWQFRKSKHGTIVNPQGLNVIQGGEKNPIMEVKVSPSAEKLLVQRGSGYYEVYDASGKKIEDVPKGPRPDLVAIAWQWKDSKTLIGMEVVSKMRPPNTYPDTDAFPEYTHLFLHHLEDGRLVYPVSLPNVPPGLVVRLEGVTSSGGVHLSTVKPEDYFGGSSIADLGVYEIKLK